MAAPPSVVLSCGALPVTPQRRRRRTPSSGWPSWPD